MVYRGDLEGPSRPNCLKKKSGAGVQKNNCRVKWGTAKISRVSFLCFGQCLLCGTDEAREEVSETVSKIVDLAVQAHGEKKAIAELLLAETHQKLLEGIRVPDWVLIYFKLQTRLPDAGWQTLLNLSQLGRSRVSLNPIG